MTATDARVLTDGRERLLTRALQVVLAGIAGYGVLQGSTGVAVNATGALAATFLPALLRRELSISPGAGATLVLTLAVFLHAVGLLGPYQQREWWHYLTHGLSGAVVATIGYVAMRAVERDAEGVEIPSRLFPLFVVDAALAAGVLWEVIEFGVGMAGSSMLTIYGVDDVATDLVFTGVGGLLAAVFATEYVRRLSRPVARRLGG